MKITPCVDAGSYSWRATQKIFLVVKLIVLLLVVSLQVSANAFAQTVTLSVSNVPLSVVFTAVEKQTGYHFFWRGAEVAEAKVTVDLKNTPLEEAVTKILGNLPYSYSITKESIVIRKQPSAGRKSENSVRVSSRQQTASGRVVDQDGNPIAGVSVKVKGGQLATITNEDGMFSLSNVPNGATLEISSIGYTRVEVAAGAGLTIELSDQVSILEEVVVIPYGTATRATYTGSVAQIGSEAIEKRPITNVTNALVGAAPGVQTSIAGGSPGSEPTVRIRGFGSISASNSPLYVVDGVPYDGTTTSLNPDDIESVSVLKDAATTALYGSRGANGVIMITTKKGKAGRNSLSFKATAGIVERGLPEYDRVDAFQYYPMMWEVQRNTLHYGSGIPLDVANSIASGLTTEYNGNNYSGVHSLLGYNPFNVASDAVVDLNGNLNPNARLLYADDLNWSEQAATGGKSRQNYMLSYDGGNEKSNFFGSLAYTNEQGYLIKSKLERFNGRLNVATQPVSWFNTGLNLSGTYTMTKPENAGGSSFINPFYISRFIAPIYPVHLHDPVTGEYLLDENGNRQYDFGDGRPFSSGRHTIFENLNDDQLEILGALNARAFAEVLFHPTLKFRSNIAFDLDDRHRRTYDNPILGDGAPSARSYHNFYRRTSYTFNNGLEYDKRFGDHHLTALALHEVYAYKYNTLAGSRSGIIVDGITELPNFANVLGVSSVEDRATIESFLGRVAYDFDQKYVVSASLRRDGNSRFHPDFRWETFWSVGGAWNIEKERFFQVSWVDYLKLRASYGTVGNDAGLGYYPYQALYTLGRNNAGEPGFVQASLPNDSLTWETAKNFDLGLEFSVLKGRLNGAVEFFNKVTDGLIFPVPQQLANGGTTSGSHNFEIDMNIGSLYNRGVEVQLNGHIVKTDNFNYTAALNWTSFKNQITKMPNNQPLLISSGSGNTNKGYSEGHSIYDFYMREFYGVDPETGDALYKTNITSDNTQIIGQDTVTNQYSEANLRYTGTSSIPDFYGSMTHTFAYKNFSLGIQFTYQVGGEVYDFAYASLMHGGTYGTALHTDILNRWQQPGDITDVPRLDNGNITNQTGASSRFLTSASYLQLNSVILSYNVPSRWLDRIHARRASVFLSGENLALLSARKGMDVSGSFNGSVGNDYTFSRIFSAGINLSF
nr:SusC/RagA family TonB-linked outer membrane protein [Parapedobacter sp. ISTM3]